MRLSSKSGLTTRFLTFVSGAALIVASAPHVLSFMADRGAGLDLTLLLLLGVPVVLMMVWAVIGSHYEWLIGDRHLRIRSRHLTSWQRDVLIFPEQIDTIDRETHTLGGDSDNGLPCHTLIVTLNDGRRFESPRLFDDAQLTRAWRKLEALHHRG